ncbi:hypothetical protein XELAEV_18006142mg [Xenopus laevis]|uniref:Cilia- and flagella-associated protein 299 n=1 Tax=Xenopus laevis TaxID=8355 RepID=A0A974I3A1_XENLA|nr:hypothetical protein XELAEV_18006142mg [Xenopus laevis]
MQENNVSVSPVHKFAPAASKRAATGACECFRISGRPEIHGDLQVYWQLDRLVGHQGFALGAGVSWDKESPKDSQSFQTEVVYRAKRCSFYNWESHVSTSNPSPNYQVIAETSSGLLFKNKRDRKILNVDPKASPGDNSTRTSIQTDIYIQAVIYDHITRRKA